MYLYRHAIYFTNILKDDSNHYLSEIKNWKKIYIFQFLNSIPEQEPTRTAIEIRVKVKQEGNAKKEEEEEDVVGIEKQFFVAHHFDLRRFE